MASIDQITPTRNLIDLNSHSTGDFGLDDFILSGVYGDIILVEYIDLAADGDSILRNAQSKSWRKAKVVLVGCDVRFTKVDDIVLFPNDKGITVANIEVKGYGKLKRGMFLNEQRLFGKCDRA